MSAPLRFLGGLLLLLVTALLVAVTLSWAPDRPVDELRARWAPPPSTFVAVDGMQVHLRDEGPRDDPMPIVLLHGTSSSLHTWQGWAEGLRERRRVVRFDLPGFGLTGPRPDGDYRISAYVGFVLDMLGHLDIRHAELVGNSFGGRLAWETALVQPQRIGRVVLIDASGYPLHPQSVPIGFRLATLPGFDLLMPYVLPRGVIEASVRDVYGDPGRVTPQLVDRYYELTLRAGNRAALPQRLAQAPPGDDSERIRDVRQPTLILWGRRDRLIPLADGERFHRDIPGSTLVVFDDLGHVPQEEAPARTLAAARDFLDGK